MPPLSLPTLRGYVLEEVLAKLIQNTGYRLLVDASQDVEELRNLPNGLAIRGRGGDHQVDVLGELAWIPALTFPLRLIVEAKARGGTIGIDDVRNAVGVVTDVNQNFSRSALPNVVPLQKFAYRYVLFSTSGFSSPATDYALAHQISLVDLSTDDFADLVRIANDVAEAIWDPDPPSRAGGYVRRLRTRLRTALGTWPDGVLHPEGGDEPSTSWRTIERILSEGVAAIGELFVAMRTGPTYSFCAHAARNVLSSFSTKPPCETSRSTGARTAETGPVGSSLCPGRRRAGNSASHFPGRWQLGSSTRMPTPDAERCSSRRASSR